MKLLKRLLFSLIIIIIVLAGVIYGISLAKYDGNIKLALVNIVSQFTRKS